MAQAAAAVSGPVAPLASNGEEGHDRGQVGTGAITDSTAGAEQGLQLPWALPVQC